MENTVRNPLKHLAVLAAAGEECNVFLQGQLSNDLRELTAHRAQLSSLNSAKGRVLAVLQVARLGTGVVAVLPSAIGPSVLEHLNKFVLRTKVTLTVDDKADCFGLMGENANDALERLGGQSLERDWASVALDGGMVAWRAPGRVCRIIVAGPTAKVTKAYDSLSELPVGDLHSWRLQDILASIPEMLPPTQDKFVAQMLRLDDLGAISFTKGCYTGQEVIARAHYLGKVKRGSVVGCTQAKRPLKPAEVLEVEGKPAAIVVSAAPTPEGGQTVLAVLHQEFPAGTKFTAADGVEVSLGAKA
ncbi:MAG: folate-binding protein YgfZ [Gammaproteobacteria bacterium]